MGTRAIIEKGKKFYATHWDGYPEELGKHLLEGMSISKIREKHNIDSTNKNTYGDWAEYQYVIKGNKVFYRELGGTYPQSLKTAGKLKLLGTIKNTKR